MAKVDLKREKRKRRKLLQKSNKIFLTKQEMIVLLQIDVVDKLVKPNQWNFDTTNVKQSTSG